MQAEENFFQPEKTAGEKREASFFSSPETAGPFDETAFRMYSFSGAE